MLPHAKTVATLINLDFQPSEKVPGRCRRPRETALPRRTREAFLDRTDQAGRAVGDDQQRIGQAAPSHVLEELAAARRVLLASWRPRRAQSGDL